MIKNNPPSRKLLILLLLIGISSISISPILNKFSSAAPITIATYRMFWATLLTFFIARKGLEKIAHITRWEWFLLIVSGTALAVHFWSWIASLTMTSVAISTLLVSIHPIIVIPLSIFLFKERFDFRKIIGIVLVLVGSAGFMLINGRSDSLSILIESPTGSLSSALIGMLLAVLGAITIAVYLIIGRALRPRILTRTYTFIVYAIASAVLFSMMIFTPSREWLPDSIKLTDHLLFILMAIIPTLLGHSILNYLLQWIDASAISIATLGEPIIASFIAWFLFKEYLTFAELLLGMVILTGIILTEYASKKRMT